MVGGIDDEMWTKYASAFRDDPTACTRCDGCKQVVDTTDHDPPNPNGGDPWWQWAALKYPSNFGVVMGIVKPMTCPMCNGSGTTTPLSNPSEIPLAEEEF